MYQLGSVSYMSALPIGMLEASTKMWKDFDQSGGCMTSTWVNIILSASYVLSFIVVHWHEVRCTTVYRGVAKSAKYRNMRLCQHICLRKRLRAFALLGVLASTIALILLGSTAMPSLTMWPSNASLVTPNAHLAGLRLRHEGRCHFKNIRKWPKCSPRVPYTAKSSRKTCMNASIKSSNISVIVY